MIDAEESEVLQGGMKYRYKGVGQDAVYVGGPEKAYLMIG